MSKLFEGERAWERSSIKSTKSQASVEVASYLDILTRECCAEKFKLVALSVNKAVFGIYRLGEIVFPLGAPEEQYLLELRAFNENKEVYLRKQGDKYLVRTIVDGSGEDIDVVDAVSNLFGERIEASELAEGFVKLVEEGRKINVVIPAEVLANHYALKTRSYIECDEETGQAGYGYFRYVDIVESAKE